MKRTTYWWEKTLEYYISEKEFISKMYKELIQLNSKQTPKQSNLKKWNIAICNNTDGSKCCAKWNKSNRGRQTPDDLTYTWNLKNNTQTKWKEHRYREQMGGCQMGGIEVGKIGEEDWEVKTSSDKTNKPQEHFILQKDNDQ